MAQNTVQIPATINQYLRDYQQEGVRFLYEHYMSEAGAVLCDDMGLGKTVQVIAFMCSVLRKRCTKTDVLLTGPKQVRQKLLKLLQPCLCPQALPSSFSMLHTINIEKLGTGL